jgi:hypothetical protein
MGNTIIDRTGSRLLGVLPLFHTCLGVAAGRLALVCAQRDSTSVLECQATLYLLPVTLPTLYNHTYSKYFIAFFINSGKLL